MWPAKMFFETECRKVTHPQWFQQQYFNCQGGLQFDKAATRCLEVTRRLAPSLSGRLSRRARGREPSNFLKKFLFLSVSPNLICPSLRRAALRVSSWLSGTLTHSAAIATNEPATPWV